MKRTMCQYCAPVRSGGHPVCRKVAAGCYFCTRKAGHDGPCVACGSFAGSHDITGNTDDELNIRPAPISFNARRCVCVRSVPAGGSFPYYSPAVLVERVTKDGRRVWRVQDSRPIDRDFRSKAKAIKVAEEIAADLGIPVRLGARHNRPVSYDRR